MENRETPEQSRLSASEYDSMKGREGILGSILCRKWKVGLGSVLDGGSECDSLKWDARGGVSNGEGRGDSVKRWGHKVAEENEGFAMIRVACEMGKLGLGGLKRDVKVSFDFRTACEMELGVRNGFIGPLGFHTVFRTVLGVQNFRMLNENFTDCAKWVRRVNLFLHSVRNWFIGCAKFLHPMRNEPWISQGVRIVLVFPLCEVFRLWGLLCNWSSKT